MDNDTAQILIKTLLEDRKKQEETHNQTQQLLLQAIGALNNNNGSESAATLQVPARNTPNNPTRLTTDALFKNESGPVDVDSFQTGSLFTTDDDTPSDVDDSESWHTQEPLQPETFDEEGFKKYILEHDFSSASLACLEGVADPKRQKEFLSRSPTIFPSDLEGSPDRSHLTHYEIFNVGADGAPMQILPSAGSAPVSRSLSIWNRIKATNSDPQKQSKAVGRITIVREPSPLLFAALHYTHSKHFDMDEMCSFLVDDDPALIRTPQAFSDKDTHKRSFAITFEYFTLIGEGCQPMSWQKSDLVGGEINRTHIPISRCSSVVALSLEGPPMGHVKNKKRRAQKRYGDVFDPFAPWRILNVQCHPDMRASLDAHDSTKHYVNGPEAFLVTLCAEYKDAVKRLTAIHKAVTDLVKPPVDFIFSLSTRDKLLFEDSEFTYSRRYFWAFNTLGVMNEDIEDMMTSYYEAFKDSVWDGTDKIIWPGSAEANASAKHTNWHKKMKRLRADIEEQMNHLREAHRLNEDRMKYVKNLHNNLFNGTSVLESRRSVENAIITVNQGRNIKLLTLVTIFFLPLTFVTSVFGMTNLPMDESMAHFAYSTIAICIPTYLLIGSLNTESGMQWWSRQVKRWSGSLSSLGHAFAWCLALFGYRPKWTRSYHERKQIEKSTSQPNFNDPNWAPKAVRPRRPRHMSNDLPHRDTFKGMPMLSNQSTAEMDKSNGIMEGINRTISNGQAESGQREPQTPTESFSFRPQRLRLQSNSTGTPPPHRPSIGVVPLPGQRLPTQHLPAEPPPPASPTEGDLDHPRRRETMNTIISEKEDAISVTSSKSSEGTKRGSFLQKVLGGRKKKTDDVP